MKNIWSILCQNSSVDSNTNLLSIFNCFEELSLAIEKNKMPKDNNLVIPIGFQLINFWTIENKDIKSVLDIKLEIFDPEEKLLDTFNKDFNVPSGVARFRGILNINGIKVTKEGRYIIKVLQKEGDEKKFKTMAELPLDIKITYK